MRSPIKKSRGLLFLVLIAALTHSALAADYPSRAVTLIVAFPPGGGADVQARVVAKALSNRLGVPVVVDNRPGAGGRTGSSLAARAKPDGHTLYLAAVSALVIYPTLESTLGYDPQRDFIPIAETIETPFLLVVPSSLPVRSTSELVARAKAQSGVSSYASWGPASPAHILGEMLNAAAGADLTHVPYKGEAPALTDLLGGQVSMMFLTPVAALAHLRTGKLRAIGVTGSRRLTALPDVPTLEESGIRGLSLTAWYAFMVPAGTPPEMVDHLRKNIVDVLQSSEFTQWATAQSAVVLAGSPADVTQRIRAESASIKKLISTRKLDLNE